MKRTIYYFSATGNSLHVSKSIAEILGDCALLSIPSLRQCETITADSEMVGFVFPLYYFGIPPMVSEFIQKIRMEKVKYSFVVVTSGMGRHVSSALRQADDLFAQKGRHLDAGFHVAMISSYIPLSDIPPTEKMHQKLAKADLKIQEIASTLLSEKPFREAEPFRVPLHAYHKFWKNHQLPHVHQKFFCTSSCTSCGTCEKVCPVNNIRMKDNKPQWLENCQECLACLHFCPAKSIEFGGRTKGRRRYHHPKVSVADIIRSK
ncbi:4Fe-4S binding protein [Heliobacterium chlorum]|uniref:4Fe-4S binding protein n=1 Tax=Heliobacterium chlorum TaxID=2698 RepID=A0ABR7T5Y3_HELCL|nr:EFR1 family ferrodoxin [Heliobacterium chlorum]MBC9786182.1 4Fe-4S binding protein [Heliobacterium chlorum]